MRRAVIVATLLLAACGADLADAPLWGERPAEGLDLRARLGVTESRLLDEVVLTLDLYRAEGVSAEFEPRIPDGFAGTVETSAPRAHAGGTWVRHRLRLRPTAVGEAKIPPFRVAADGERTVATTPELGLSVASLLDGAGDSVEPPAPPFPVPFDPRPWIAGLAAAAVIALAWVRWRRRDRSMPATSGTSVPPHVRALRALARLRSAPRSTPPEVDEFYVGLSQVLRVYLEERFGLHAPERTTEEFLPEVEHSGVLSAEQQHHLRQFLQQCDLVKFARMFPPADVHEHTFAFAEELVESTRPDLTQEEVA